VKKKRKKKKKNSIHSEFVLDQRVY